MTRWSCCPLDRSNGCAGTAPGRPFSVLRLLGQVLVLYAILVFGGGTLINTGHPVAQEVGRLLQTVTCIEPAIYWTQGQGLTTISGGLRTLAGGIPLQNLG